jgi:hypothetical protein
VTVETVSASQLEHRPRRVIEVDGATLTCGVVFARLSKSGYQNPRLFRSPKPGLRAAAARPSKAREASRCDSEGAASCVHRTEVTCGGDDDTAVIVAIVR